MRKLLAGTVLVVVFLAALMPLASRSPDGLETVAKTLGARAPDSSLQTIIGNFAPLIQENSSLYVILEGSLGVLAVLSAGFLLGKTLAPNKK